MVIFTADTTEMMSFIIWLQQQITQHQWPQTDSLVHIYIYTLRKQQVSVSWVCKHNLYSQWILQLKKIETMSKYAIYCIIIKLSPHILVSLLTVYTPSYGVRYIECVKYIIYTVYKYSHIPCIYSLKQTFLQFCRINYTPAQYRFNSLLLNELFFTVLKEHWDKPSFHNQGNNTNGCHNNHSTD